MKYKVSFKKEYDGYTMGFSEIYEVRKPWDAKNKAISRCLDEIKRIQEALENTNSGKFIWGRQSGEVGIWELMNKEEFPKYPKAGQAICKFFDFFVEEVE